MNNATLIGRLTKDPELRYTANNFPVCTFRIAIDRVGKAEKKTNFIPVKALGRAAETCGQYLTKGKLVAVHGSIETDSYEKNGEKHYTWEVLASGVEFLEWGEKNNTQNMRADATVANNATVEPTGDWKQAQATINQTLGINPRFDDFDDFPI